jgi:hypothetical protein
LLSLCWVAFDGLRKLPAVREQLVAARSVNCVEISRLKGTERPICRMADGLSEAAILSPFNLVKVVETVDDVFTESRNVPRINHTSQLEGEDLGYPC